MTPQGRLKSNLMVPVESPWALLNIASVKSNTVSLTVWPEITRVTTHPTKDSYNVCRNRSSMQYYALHPGPKNAYKPKAKIVYL